MDIFDGLSALGGLCLFLFGMSIMAEALQRRAGGRLGGQLRRMTRSPASFSRVLHMQPSTTGSVV